MDQVEELEQAILAQANRLASEYRERAERSRDNILREAGERLHLREEREVLLAKLAGAFKQSLFGAAYLFNAPLSKAVRTVDALRQKQEA